MPSADQYKEFCNLMGELTRRHDVGRVFDDFVTMAVCSLHQINLASRLQEKDADNEAIYMNTIKSYKSEELNIFSKLLGILQVHVYHNPYSDLLGRYFTEYVTQGHNGQYFTPVPVCSLMGQMSMNRDETITGKTVYDPSCGSGRLLLEFAKVSPDNYFYANDVSRTCAKMTAVNFMLNGLRGEVAWMNSLSMEFYGAWSVNVPTLGLAPIEKEQSYIWTEPSAKKQTPDFPGKAFIVGDQLSLF